MNDRELLELNVKIAKDMMERLRGIIPMLTLELPDGSFKLLGMTNYNPETREAWLEEAKRVVEELDVQRYVHISEAWVASYVRADPAPGEPGYRPPREREDRRESLTLTLVSRDGVLSWTADIVRDAEGEYSHLVNEEFSDAAVIGGAFTELLP